jgi:formamidopyrimidine-DNA glycosylase
VGNIYADEALFLSEIRPTRRASHIRPPEWGVLAKAIRQILAAAVTARGSSLRDYLDATGASGTAQERHRVYGRGHLPCTRCGKLLTVCTVAQRTTVFCRFCQK